MIVIGTSKEYINSVWVKNEWSRFLNLAKKDTEKLLIPTYKQMGPYDLPEEFAHLQAIDLSKIAAITDLTNKIEATINHKNKKQKDKKPTRKQKTIMIIICLIILLIVIGTIVLNNVILPEVQYKKAEKLMNENKYNEAIEIYQKLNNYKDSSSKVVTSVVKKEEKSSEELSKYIGLYDKTEKMTNFAGDEVGVGYSLEIKKASSSKIEFTLSNVGLSTRIATISPTAKLKGNVYEFTYEDSWMNKGKGILQLLEDGITIDLKGETEPTGMFGIGEGKLEFQFKDMKTE